MKIWIFILTSMFYCSVYGQLAFSFSGLNWGDNPKRVAQILKAGEFSDLSFVEIKKCEFLNECTLEFDGPSIVRGYLFFKDGGLDRVTVTVLKSLNIEKTLIGKYGNPMPPNINSDMSAYQKSIEYMYMRWGGGSGGGLSLYDGISLDYKSPRFYDRPMINKSLF